MNEGLDKPNKTAEQEPMRGKILLVDDDVVMTELTAKSLQLENFAVETAGVTQDAFQLLAKNQYDGLIVDGLNGGWVGLAKMALNLGLKVILHTTDPDRYKNDPLITSGQVRLLAKPALAEDFIINLQ